MAEPDSTMANTRAVHLSSLTKSFSLVPLASVPAIIDCVLTSSVLSASNLYSSLLQSFPDFNEAHQSNYILCYTSALCHLMKNHRAPPDAMSQFILRVFIPLLEAIDPSNSHLLNQIEELLYQVVFKTGSWELMEKILVSFCLKSVSLSMNELPKDDMGVDKQSFEFSSEPLGTLPRQTAFRVLNSLLEFALRSGRDVTTSEQKILQFSSSLVSFTVNLTRKLSNLTLGLLKLSAEDRSCAIHLLLSVVLRSFNALSVFKVLEHEPQCSLSRSLFLEKMWNCCYSLFQLGHIERRDAYYILSMYFSSFYDLGGAEKIAVVNINEEFDITGKGVFWEQIQRGLVDRDASVRKMALYILKSLLNYCSSLLSENVQCSSTCTKIAAISKKINTISQDRDTSHVSLTKKEKWSENEAKSLVGEVSHLDGTCLNCGERWKIFVLLYEMLEEYDTHLVEAAWNHQILLLFQCTPLNNDQSSTILVVYYAQMERLEGIMSWLAILWERGFCHENPQVRCLIMQSFLGIDWARYENNALKVPRSFILGPLLRGLNDPVQHKDFGLKGVYKSRTIEGASKYLSRVSYRLSVSERLTLAWSLASVVRYESFGRAGLMALAFCISSTTCHSNANDEREAQCPAAISMVEQVDSTPSNVMHSSAVELLDALQIVIARCKHHFNPNYRLQVSKQVLKAASLLINVYDVSLEVLLHFLSIIPREFIDINGSLRWILQAWIFKIRNDGGNIGLIDSRMYLLKNLFGFPSSFIYYGLTSDGSLSFDDEDIDAWLVEAQRWAWMLFLVIREDEDLVPLYEFFKSYSGNLCKEPNKECICIKLLILILCFIKESQVVWKKLKCLGEAQVRTERIGVNLEYSIMSALFASEKFIGRFPIVMDEIVSFARLVLPVFWSISVVKDIQLPSSIKGKLGGPTQRRLATSTTSAVLLSIMAMRTIASMVSVCALIKDDIPDILFGFSWEFVWKVIQFRPYKSETGSELCLAAYEALAHVLKTLSPNFGLSEFSLMMSFNKLEFTNGDRKSLLDHLLLSFLTGINDLLANGFLTRSRRAVLMDWKWNCLDSLLSIPYNVLNRRSQLEDEWYFFSSSALQTTLADISESLEMAGENSVLSMLRSTRLVLGLLYSNKVGPTVSPCQGVNSQMMFQLVKSSWILHLSCNKRRVAPIAALLSAVLHESVFGDLTMHETDGDKGPLKWFIQNLLDEGTRSPRTMRLAALHLTGLWLLHPRTLKYYMKELKLLSLYGSVAFDEDFEAELCENHEAKVEVSLLAQSPDPELTRVFINTEMYARVAVAVLFNKLCNLSNGGGKLEKRDSATALNCGKMFLLELLDSVVNERDLAKELYKKFSSVHRRKVRAWQIICILSHFVEVDILENVTSNLHICLYRNNLPAVRQFLETFAIQIYLKFPTLAEEQLIPIFYDYKMRPQALSSYVFIAANVILHSRELPVQMKHLDMLLPPVIPFLTSHHHSLRCFTQLLVYHVLCKLWPAFTACKSDLVPLEGRCFDNLKSYLAGNIDCVRIRDSMEGFLENFDPIASATPAGVFNSQSEGSEFECVPVSLMEIVIAFLNMQDVRDDLRSSFAKDEMTIKNERLTSNGTLDEVFNSKETSPMQILKNPSLDFQKKITPRIHEGQSAYNHLCFLASSNSSSILSELEMEDLLLSSVIQSRKEVMERIRDDQQQIILVASLLDRIPNLAGLARTCEIFGVACLAIADSSIVQDKQFQLISVTAEKWVPIIEVPVCSIKIFLEKKRREGFSILGLEQTANSMALDKFSFPNKTVLVLGREKEGIPVDIIHVLDACIEIPQMGIIRSLNVHVSGAIALWEYTRQQRCMQQ